jgi:hypothetical protein
VFALQYINRPGNGYGGYIVHDDKGLVFIAAASSDIRRVYVWVGNGDANKGRELMNDAFSMPNVMLNPAQYNAMVCGMPLHTERSFVKEG